MHMTPRLLALALAAAFSLSAAAQPPAPAAQPAAPAPVTSSSILRPALDTVSSAVNALKADKWKRGSVRDEAGQDAGSILTDIQVHLPPLLSAADAAPALVSRQIPVARNIDALYDVLLRVYDAARIAAPADQVGTLQQALAALSKARLALYDQMDQSSAAQEKLLADLRSTVQKHTDQIAATPPPAPCPTPPTKSKRKKSTKPSPAKQ